MKNLDEAVKMLNKITFFVELVQNVGNYFKESPQDEYQRLLNEREVVLESHKTLLNKRKKEDEQGATSFLYFFKINSLSDDEKELRQVEDKLFEQKENELNQRILKLEKKLGINKSLFNLF